MGWHMITLFILICVCISVNNVYYLPYDVGKCLNDKDKDVGDGQKTKYKRKIQTTMEKKNRKKIGVLYSFMVNFSVLFVTL